MFSQNPAFQSEDPTPSEASSLPRRGFLRSGAVTETSSKTGLRIGGNNGAGAPTLSLENANGPSLYLEPLDADFGGALELGQVANTTLGPVVGVDTEAGLSTTFLATGVDLADLPTPYALQTRSRALRRADPRLRRHPRRRRPRWFYGPG